MMINIKLDKFAVAPTRGHATDAGLDLRSPIDTVVPANGNVCIDTGIHIDVPCEFAGFIKSKSGLNVKHNITADGVIDTGYTGSIVVKLYNHGDEDYKIEKGDKIAQLVLVKIALPGLGLAHIENDDARDNNGFGSTGR